jgi:glycosyltransferase involved in cell wall biosynthesis
MTDSQNRISIALCTYNGERFLPRQLASIQQQTVLPFELVVCDDCSSDNTNEIVRDFAASALFPVRVFRNDQNLGFVANFERAIELCQGDLIALSDQDDIWYPTRLERAQVAFAAHPEVGLVFSDADVIDEHGELTGERLWMNFGFEGDLKQRMMKGDYTVLVRNRFVTGATVMFRSCLRVNCLPFGAGWLHDEWLAPAAAAVSDVLLIDDPLIRYRKHASQQVGLSPQPGRREKQRKHWSELSRQISMLEQMCIWLSQQPLSPRGELLYSCYQAHLQFARFRFALPRRRLWRLGPMLRHYAAYSICGSGVLSMATDIFVGK